MTSTSPSPDYKSSLVFALASCQYPPGLLDRDLANRTLDRLADLPKEDGPRFLIQVGDQIYADATAGLFDPGQLDQALGQAYEASTHGLGIGRVRDRFVEMAGCMSGIYTMLDDHEISDNWEPEPSSPPNETQRNAACEAYVIKCRSDPKRPGYLSTYISDAPLWYTEVDAWTGHRFFVADTRTARTPRNSIELNSACILGPEQCSQLRAWLASGSREQVSFVASPAIFLPRRLASATHPDAALHSDAWDGYPASLQKLLACVCDEARGPVVFLSGDEHLSCVATIEICRRDQPESMVVAHSIHSSALYAPYPFANGLQENFARTETFEFNQVDAAGVIVRYTCHVETWFPEPADSVAVIALRARGEGGYRLEVDFHAGEAPASAEPQHWSTDLPG